MTTPTTFPDLLARAQAGDEAAFDELIRPHRGTVERFSRAFARNATDADDIVQETLLRAFRSIGSFRQDSALSTWLYTLTRNAGIDWYRRKQHREYPEEFENEPPTQDGREKKQRPDALLGDKDQVDLLYQAIQELPPMFRVPLILCEMEGMAYEDVASIESVPVGTVRSRLNRARKHLAELMSNVERLEAALGSESSLPPTEGES